MKRMLVFTAVAVSLQVLLSCSENVSLTSGEAGMRITVSPVDSSAQSRSVLDETALFEDMISCMTVAAFDNETGYLAGYAYGRSGELDISLPMDRTYRLFVLANMGDMTGDIPCSMDDMQSVRYDVSSYSRLRSAGLPMSCVAVTPWTPEVTLDLRRLMAKLVIRVDKGDIAEMGGGGETSFRNYGVAVHRVSRILYPFAPDGSAAKDTDELFDSEDVEYDTFADVTAISSEEVLLYVPENMQGSGLSGKELCTYVSMNGYKDGNMDGVYGDFIYRFFPGYDNVSNFDLRGGKRYDITLKLTWNGLFAEGEWKVERSGWRDSRRMLVSLSPDSGYMRDLSVNLARGSERVPVYVRFSPQGNSSGHYHKGWMFSPAYSLDGESSSPSPSPRENTGEFTGSMMSTGFVEHEDSWTRHYVSIPSSTPAGYGNTVRYTTNDGRAGSQIRITVTEPVIRYSPSSMLFMFYEYGYDSRRTIRIYPSSPVRPVNITAYTFDDDLITLGTFDHQTGKVDVYWNDTNTSSIPKTAKVYLHSEPCGVTSVCTLVQQNRPALSIADEEMSGDAYIEY